MFVQQIFEKQRHTSQQLRETTAEQRKVKLRRLKTAIQRREQEIYAALKKDLRKHEVEAALSEVFFIYSEIDFAIKHLNSWMKPKRVSADLINILTSNELRYEPKGVCLILAPWNYPFQLVMSPLISAIAAGNCVILKPSEVSPATSAVISQLVAETFPQEEIACIEGDAQVAQELLYLPFDHIFFTGSTAVGKIVMGAAAKSLASVTLELGGKSPVIIDEHTNLKKAAEKIIWGKLLNAGQTCIAPDYILLPQQSQKEFTNYIRSAIQTLYGKETNKTDYGKIINERHFNRLKELLTDAINKGAKLEEGGQFEDDLTFSPTILTGLTEDMKITQEEIFGPILPILSYTNLSEAIAFINKQAKPLALYIFSNRSSIVERILASVSSGGVCINDVLIHISNPNLPFGGVGWSGQGNCHGFFGFKAFSHERAVMRQAKWDFNKIAYPPYRTKNWILTWLRKLV